MKNLLIAIVGLMATVAFANEPAKTEEKPKEQVQHAGKKIKKAAKGAPAAETHAAPATEAPAHGEHK